MITEIINVFVAVLLFEIMMRIFDYYRNRKPDLKCDGCHEVKKLYKIRGQKLYYCYHCKSVYNREIKNGEVMYGNDY